MNLKNEQYPIIFVRQKALKVFFANTKT